MDGHLVKPYKPNELYNAVENSANNDANPTHAVPVLDDAAALETAGGDAGLVDLLRETCLKETPTLIANAKLAIEQQDWKTVRRSAHSLRSSLGAIGALAASAESGEMEMLTADDAVEFLKRLQSVEVAFQQVVERLQSQ